MDERFSKLGGLDRQIAAFGASPRGLVYVSTAMLAIAAWIWLTIAASGTAFSEGARTLGPGMAAFQGTFDWLSDRLGGSSIGRFLLTVCTPNASQSLGTSDYPIAVFMWFSMSLAMMLPSAAPMIATYADIADTAEVKGEKTISVSVLAAGYLLVWFSFSVVAALITLALGGVRGTLGGLSAAIVLILCGSYQFTSLRHACLEKCRNPFTTLFGAWRDDFWGVLKLGIEQGLFCLGCCWALMGVMLIAGTMNLIWMVLLALFAILEKSVQGHSTSRLSGFILIIWGGALAISTII